MEKVLDFVMSVLLLHFMTQNREDITPDFFHFITCLTEEEGHYFTCFFYWIVWKCFLLDAITIESYSDACVQRLKQNSRVAILECLLVFYYEGKATSMVYILYILGVHILY